MLFIFISLKRSVLLDRYKSVNCTCNISVNIHGIILVIILMNGLLFIFFPNSFIQFPHHPLVLLIMEPS